MANTDGRRRCANADCRAWLASDNTATLCSPCQSADRARPPGPPEVPAEFWLDGDLQAALDTRHMGNVIRAYRQHPHHGRRGLTQATVASWAGITQGQLSTIESPGSPINHLDRLIAWAQLLGIPEQYLWFKLPDAARVERGGDSSSGPSSMADPAKAQALLAPGVLSRLLGEPADPNLDDSQRSAAALTAVSMSRELDGLLSPTDGSGNLSVEHLQLLESCVMMLERRDATSGGGAALDMAVMLHDRLTRWLRDLGPDLLARGQKAYCDLGALIGWLAYDAGKPSMARRYVNDAIASARLADDADADLRAMNTMCLLLSDSGRPREALRCAEQAIRIADGQATFRTRALLYVRSARTYAKLGDGEGFRRQLVLAEGHLDQADQVPAKGDPPWVHFLDRLELSAAVGGSYLLLGDPSRAVDAYREAVDGSHASNLRNALSRTVWLADALLQQGDVSLASRTALDTVPSVRTLSSIRVAKRLHRLRRSLDPYTLAVPDATDFAEAYDEAFSL